MPSGDIRAFTLSGSGLSVPPSLVSSNATEVVYEVGNNVDAPVVDDREVMAQFRGKVFRVMDDRLFAVDPGSPPGVPPAQ